MADPRGWQVDPETLREVPHDAAAMRTLLAELRVAADGEPAAQARRLGEAGVYARMLGELAEAECLLQRALELVPDGESSLRFTLRLRRAHVWHWLRRCAEADREFALLLQEAPPALRSFVLQHAGKSLFDQQRYEEARAAFAAALALREARGEAELAASTRIALARVERALRG
jgi:tetratricopeptide (TPR) repeat protein